MYPYITISEHQVPTYYICILIGLLGAIILSMIRVRRGNFSISLYDVFFLILSIMIGALCGAKIFQLIGYIIRDGNMPGFWTVNNWLQLLKGVGVFYGGLIGGGVAAIIYCHKNNICFFEATDALIPSVLLFNVWGRLGCFFAGCCYGCASSWGIEFKNSVIAPNFVTLVPVQLFESAFNLLILNIILLFRPEKNKRGILFPLYIITYSIGRFILEFFRGDIGRGIFIISTSQWLSIIILPIGVIVLKHILKKTSV